MLLRTRAALADTAVETRNQVDYYASRCAGVDTRCACSAAARRRHRERRARTRHTAAHAVKDSSRTDSVTQSRREPTASTKRRAASRHRAGA